MDTKKYLIASIVVFVVYSALAILIHQLLLAADYTQATLAAALRSEQAFLQRMPMLYLGNLIFALAFCFIYARGYEAAKSWLGQGLRYGLLVGTLVAPFAITEYVVYPVPGALLLKWLAFGYLQVVLAGLAGAAIYRTEPAG